MPITISTRYTHGISLGVPAYNPITILQGGALVSNTAAIFGDTSAYWTIGNAGTLIGGGDTAALHYGIGLTGGGAISNDATSALIQGYGFGVLIDQSGTVVNDGTIVSTATGIRGYKYYSPVASPTASITAIAGGVVLGGGGVSNAQGATIAGEIGIGLNGSGSIVNAGLVTAAGTGANSGIGVVLAGIDTLTNVTGGLIAAAKHGVLAVGDPVTIENEGTIVGTSGSGVLLTSGGALFNNGGLVSGANQGALLFRGGYVRNSGTIAGIYGVTIANNAGTVVNAGGIIDGGDRGIVLANGGHVSNSGTVRGYDGVVIDAAAGTVVNLGGTILGGASTFADGVLLNDGGYVRNTGSIASYQGVVVGTAAGTIVNAGGIISGGIAGAALFGGGYIGNSGTISGRYAVFTQPNAAVVNSGAIIGVNYGVDINGTGTLDNSGIITNTRTLADATVELRVGGSLTNAAGGTISGHWIGVEVGNATAPGTVASTIINAGSIGALDSVGDGADLWLRGPVYVRNTGVISAGPFGLVLYDRSTVVNLGTITGGYDVVISGTTHHQGPIAPGNAALLAATASLRLEVGPNAVFKGDIAAPVDTLGVAANTLELLTGVGAGTISGFGTRYENFGNIVIDPGADWLVSGTAGGFAGVDISGLAPGTTLELTGTVESYAGLTGGMLTLSGGTTLDVAGVTHASVGNDGSNTFITACFATGTKLLSARGPLAVEDLREGDTLVTTSGLAPIRWIGHRRTELRRHPAPHDVMPVRVAAGAFGPSQPSDDLVLSPDHAVLVDGLLIPIRHLINGSSIAQEARDHVTYWHVELDRHDIVLAEGLSCETYLDTGNRSAFESEDGAVQLHPDFARAIWIQQGCAPILTDPADRALRAVHMRLLARAARYGVSNSTTTGTWSEGWALARSSRSGAA
jgi:hypothetical protein